MAPRSGQDDVAAMADEIERVGSLAPPSLAVEVMIKGFGPEGPGAPGRPGTIEEPLGAFRVGLEDIARQFAPTFGGRAVGPEQKKRLMNLIAEGLQILENAALVRVSNRGGYEHYLATRRGRAAVEQHEIERIIEDGTLR